MDEGQAVDQESKVNEEDVDQSEYDPQRRPSEKIYSTKSQNAGDYDDVWPGDSERRHDEAAENVGIVMKVLEGRIQRSIAMKGAHPGGVPRRWKRMRSFDELEDIDPLEAMLWTKYTSPNLPRIHMREKDMLGGEIAILRDVSTSMMGVYSEWSSSVVKAVVELARTKRMLVGYLEFNHRSFSYKKQGKFFTRDYPWILDLASRTECSGNTNYEDAFKDALVEFKGRGLRNKHILFITDGIPTTGDCEVHEERMRAKKLGVCVHSIFIGSKNYPRILSRISNETKGSQFIAMRTKHGTIKIEKKPKHYNPAFNTDRLDPLSNVFVDQFAE